MKSLFYNSKIWIWFHFISNFFLSLVSQTTKLFWKCSDKENVRIFFFNPFYVVFWLFLCFYLCYRLPCGCWCNGSIFIVDLLHCFLYFIHRNNAFIILCFYSRATTFVRYCRKTILNLASYIMECSICSLHIELVVLWGRNCNTTGFILYLHCTEVYIERDSSTKSFSKGVCIWCWFLHFCGWWWVAMDHSKKAPRILLM